MIAALDPLVRWCIRQRGMVLALTAAFAVLGGVAFRRMVFDAFPDLTNVQVQVLTTAPGLGAEEVERLVTQPLERALAGAPGLTQLRSLSRPGVSAVSVVFTDDTDPWRARQITGELVAAARAEIPPDAGVPTLGPPTTGLGEIYQFTLRSDDRSATALYRVFEREVAPRLKGIPGVVEVNAWGAGAPEVEVALDPFRLAAHGIDWEAAEAAVADALAVTSGGDLVSGPERAGVRAVGNPPDADALGEIVLQHGPGGAVRLADVARIGPGAAAPVGLGSADGEGEALFGMVQLLAGADALRTVEAVQARVAEVQATLPPDVRLEPIYSRDKLVGNTLRTVARSLAEGGLLVILVLLVLLGDLRAGLIVASVIPLSLLGAFVGLWALGVSGNLMSLGAIDFGLVVDGTIVLVESIVGLEFARRATFGEAIAERARRVSRPILFAVGILILVYLPILTMVGTEGKLFRPMALTVLFALGTALVLTFTFVPALASLVLRPGHGHAETRVLRALSTRYEPLLDALLARPAATGAGAAVLVGLTLALLPTLGLEFVPRLQEGDLVVQTGRLPSISPAQALAENQRVEQVLRRFPEVQRVATRTGSPAVATDPMGLEESDVLVRLAPRDTWTTAADTEGLAAAFAEALAADAPGAALTFVGPIEMRFNELLEGVPTDVGVVIYGPDLGALQETGARVAEVLASIPGASDVKAPSLEGTPGIDVVLDAARLGARGLDAAAVHGLIGAVQRGRPVGEVLRGAFREPVLLRLDLPAGVPLRDLPFVDAAGRTHSLGDVATVATVDRPVLVRRQGGSRRVIVTANVRGRDLGGFVREARAAVADVPLPAGAWVDWSGKYEQLAAAGTRTAITVPIVLALIFTVLTAAFRAWRPALLIFLNIPAAASGGVLALLARGMPLSMPAIVGFIALFGVAVMNGIVLVSRTRELHQAEPAARAARASARERFRPVLMTAFVAGIGFLPMALAGGVGAEVQRPLATVVIGGLLTATPLTLLVLPALYGRLFRREDPQA